MINSGWCWLVVVPVTAHPLIISRTGTNSRFRHQTSDALLELAVLGGVDERVDTDAE